MSGTDLLEFDKVFDTKMPKQRLLNGLQKSKLDEAVAQALLASSDPTVTPCVFMDLATGKDRSTESAENVCTCVRPTHRVYSNVLGRTLCAKELWNCQGLFETAFENTSAFQEIMANHTQAQDLAGQWVQKHMCWNEKYTHTYIYIHYIGGYFVFEFIMNMCRLYVTYITI